jgi:pimeloyl-ACP methyl ester carboxylesterase
LKEKNIQAAGYSCRAFLHQASGVPVVFLHGFSYTSEVWQRIGILDVLSEKKVPFLSLDMPYGKKSECQPKTQNVEKNVAFAKEAIESVFESQIPILVGASMGGYTALNCAVQFPVKGLLLISPTRVLQEHLVQAYSRFKFPVHIIWGSQDNIVSGEDLRTLSNMLPKAKLITYEGASHSAYLSQPDRFKRDLLELYASAEQS